MGIGGTCRNCLFWVICRDFLTKKKFKMKNVFKSVFNFILSQRRSGTTTLIKKIADENDVWVLVQNMADGLQFKRGSAISIHQLIGSSDGMEGKPILVDNATLLRLMDVAAKQESKLLAMKEFMDRFRKDMEIMEGMDVWR